MARDDIININVDDEEVKAHFHELAMKSKADSPVVELFLRKRATWQLRRIKFRMKKGVDVEGKSFVRYDPKYKAIRVSRGRPGRPNLMDTGQMAASFGHRFQGHGRVIMEAGLGNKTSFHYKLSKLHHDGFTGTVFVPSHTRTITQAFGKKIPSTKVHVFKYTYTLRIPARTHFDMSDKDILAHDKAHVKFVQENVSESFN